jgi:hypothetical protein
MLNRPSLKTVVETICGFSPFNLYGFTEHGFRHIKSVVLNIEILYNFLKANNDFANSYPQLYNDFAHSSNQDILIASAFLHDIGNLIGREVHHNHTKEMIQNVDLFRQILINKVGLTGDELDKIAFVCYHHRKPKPGHILENYFGDLNFIKNNITKSNGSQYWDKFRLAALSDEEKMVLVFDAALVVIADVLDITVKRAPPEIYEPLIYFWKIYPETHGFGDKYWLANQNVLGVNLQNLPKIIVGIKVLKNASKSLGDLTEDFSYSSPLFSSYQIHFTIEVMDEHGTTQPFWAPTVP